MKCPSCAQPLDPPAPRCPHCKLSLHKLDARFGLVPAHSRFLSDRSSTLTLPEMQQLRAQLRRFQRKFPQSLLSVFVIELPSETPVNEFAFWMANRARFTSADRTRGENRNLLLVVDIANHSAALTVGYGLETFVPEAALQEALDQFAAAYANGNLARAIATAIDSLAQQLSDLALQAEKTEKETTCGIETW